MQSFAPPQGFYCHTTKTGKGVENLCLGQSRGGHAPTAPGCAAAPRMSAAGASLESALGKWLFSAPAAFVSSKLESHLEATGGLLCRRRALQGCPSPSPLSPRRSSASLPAQCAPRARLRPGGGRLSSAGFQPAGASPGPEPLQRFRQPCRGSTAQRSPRSSPLAGADQAHPSSTLPRRRRC